MCSRTKNTPCVLTHDSWQMENSKFSKKNFDVFSFGKYDYSKFSIDDNENKWGRTGNVTQGERGEADKRGK